MHKTNLAVLDGALCACGQPLHNVVGSPSHVCAPASVTSGFVPLHSFVQVPGSALMNGEPMPFTIVPFPGRV